MELLHPTLGVWIEIHAERAVNNQPHSRIYPVVRGLKLLRIHRLAHRHKVAPHPGCVD